MYVYVGRIGDLLARVLNRGANTTYMYYIQLAGMLSFR